MVLQPRVLYAATVMGAFLACGCPCKKSVDRDEPPPAHVVVLDAGPLDAGPPVPAGSLLAARFGFELAVYHLPTPKRPPLPAIRKLLADTPIAYRPGDSDKPSEGASVNVGFPAVDAYAPPSEADLAYFGRGLTDQTKRDLQDTKSVTVLYFEGPTSDALSTVRAAVELVSALAEATGGVIWDGETREVYTRDAFSDHLSTWDNGIPDVRKHITIHAYRDGELLRLVTLGMRKFGLPDVAVNDVIASSSDAMASLVNLTCQLFVEKHQLEEAGRLRLSMDDLRHAAVRQSMSANPKKGARRVTSLELAQAVSQEGDAPNRLVDVLFPGQTAGLQERHVEHLVELFGADDSMVRVQHDDEILAASSRAKDAVMKLKPLYRNGPQDTEMLQVKAPFRTSGGGNEWMWVEVVRWEGNTIMGVLHNEPFDVPGLHSGARVEVDENAVFDYLRVAPDGAVEGNETGALLDRKGG